MTDVASRELSKQLYDLSGWTEPADYYWYENGLYNQYQKPPEAEFVAPAYKLGFLIRKLPRQIDGEEMRNCSISMEWLGNQWVFYYSRTDFSGTADTPEDAAAKLCIELIKQGILKGKEQT